MDRLKAGLLVLVLALSARAEAESAEAVALARTHFDAGRALYKLGHYTEAIREFSAGYELLPRPQFLLNLGQCYRKLDDFEHARELYQKFLDQAPASDPERPQVEQLIGEIDRLLASRRSQPPVVTVQPSVSLAPAQPTLVLTRSAPPSRNWARSHWWVFPVGAVAVTGLALGLYFGLRPGDCPASLGCITVAR